MTWTPLLIPLTAREAIKADVCEYTRKPPSPIIERHFFLYVVQPGLQPAAGQIWHTMMPS